MTALDQRTLERLLEKEAVTDFLVAEAELLDNWNLVAWANLFADDGRYLIEPTGDHVTGDLDPEQHFYLVTDDREKIRQRVERLGKITAHAEYPHSRTKHLFSNIRIVDRALESISVRLDFITFRNRRKQNSYFVGSSYYELRSDHEDGFKIGLKNVSLTHENLFDQGKLSIIL